MEKAGVAAAQEQQAAANASIVKHKREIDLAKVEWVIGELAARHCEGRVLTLLEGGYDVEALPGLVTTYLDALEGAAG